MQTPVSAEVQQDLDCLVTALGTRRASSDIDLLVLTNSGLTDPSVLNKALRLDTFGKLKLPLDLIVEDLQTFEERRLLPTLERKIARQGRVVYAT